MKTIPVSGPSITQREIDYVADAAANSWGKNANIYYDKFHATFADFVGARHAVSLPSCTSALHLSLVALGVGPGDEVIVPDITWIASAAPISYVGAIPIFADIAPDTWCMTAQSFEACLSDKTKAVIPVEIYGSMPDWDAIHKIASSNNIHVIEDAAEALGSEYKGKRAGTFGATGCFSFHGSKTMTTHEGGMVVSDDDALFDRILFLRDHGRIPGDVSFVNAEVAFKYKMSAMQAAMGLAQIERGQELVAGKRQIFNWYKEELEGFPGVTLNAEPEGVVNSYWMVSVILDAQYNLDKFQIMKLLKAKGVETRPFFSPLSSIPAYSKTAQAKTAAKRNTVSYAISNYGINLPSGLQLSREDVATVCSALQEILKGN